MPRTHACVPKAITNGATCQACKKAITAGFSSLHKRSPTVHPHVVVRALCHSMRMDDVVLGGSDSYSWEKQPAFPLSRDPRTNRAYQSPEIIEPRAEGTPLDFK
eukprot:6117132-Amphidinium_carterae.1